MRAALSVVETAEDTTIQHLLNRRFSLKTILRFFDGKSHLDAQEFLQLITKPKQKDFIYNRSKPRVSNKTLIPEVVLDFERHYSLQNYAKTTLNNHKHNLRGFISFLVKNFTDASPFISLNDMKSLTSAMVNAYEEYLVNRFNTEQIQLCTVNKYLVTLRMFLKMLSKKSIVNINYIIPESLRDEGKRSNEYVETEEINALLDSIVTSNSLLITRDLAVVLIVMELGSRPIEITNLKTTDISLSERLITLCCVKSGLRKLKISKDLCAVISKYLEFRSTFNIIHEYLFINAYGEPITRNGLTSIFKRANKKAFGELRFHPKALRHTYATNALDNENDFDEVSASMGHKHRCSTEWYIHRSIKRLLTRTLPHNPLKRIEESGV
ncbi:tyrosine-type recombinase/integrase [Paenibacillus sp. BAC0078]